jgi:hypothetical protein
MFFVYRLDGYQAFLSAHSTMNTIQLNMLQIPKYIKTALKLLGGNFPTRELKQLLPQILNNLEETGNECIKLANDTRSEFFQVMLLIGEVIEVTTTTESIQKGKIQENENQMSVLRTLQDGMKKEEEFRAKRYKEATDAAKRAEDTFYQALKEIPTGYDAILKDFTRGTLKTVPTLIGTAVGGPLGGMAAAYSTRGGGGEGGSPINPSSSTNSFAKQQLSVGHSQTLSMANEFANSLQSFIEAVSTKLQNTSLIQGYVTVFKTFREFITTLPHNPAKQQATNLIKRAETLAANAAAKTKQKEPKNDNNNELIQQLKQLVDEIKPLQAAAEFSDPKTGGQTISNVGNSPANSVADSSQNELFKAQVAQANLVEMKRFQDEQAAGYLGLLDEMRKLSSQMVAVNFTTIQYREIVAMLEKALGLLAKLRTQWNEFVLFFTDMSAKVKNMIKGPLRRFLQSSRVGSASKTAVRIELIQLLKDDTFGIHREAYILFVMSRTYYDVSTKYLMGRLAGLSRMLTAGSDMERTTMIQALESETNSIIAQVETLVRERKKAFDVELNKRNGELTQLITKLGGKDTNDQSAIKEGQKSIGIDAEWGDK